MPRSCTSSRLSLYRAAVLLSLRLEAFACSRTRSVSLLMTRATKNMTMNVKEYLMSATEKVYTGGTDKKSSAAMLSMVARRDGHLLVRLATITMPSRYIMAVSTSVR